MFFSFNSFFLLCLRLCFLSIWSSSLVLLFTCWRQDLDFPTLSIPSFIQYYTINSGKASNQQFVTPTAKPLYLLSRTLPSSLLPHLPFAPLSFLPSPILPLPSSLLWCLSLSLVSEIHMSKPIIYSIRFDPSFAYMAGWWLVPPLVLGGGEGRWARPRANIEKGLPDPGLSTPGILIPLAWGQVFPWDVPKYVTGQAVTRAVIYPVNYKAVTRSILTWHIP